METGAEMAEKIGDFDFMFAGCAGGYLGGIRNLGYVRKPYGDPETDRRIAGKFRTGNSGY